MHKITNLWNLNYIKICLFCFLNLNIFHLISAASLMVTCCSWNTSANQKQPGMNCHQSGVCIIRGWMKRPWIICNQRRQLNQWELIDDEQGSQLMNHSWSRYTSFWEIVSNFRQQPMGIEQWWTTDPNSWIIHDPDLSARVATNRNWPMVNSGWSQLMNHSWWL